MPINSVITCPTYYYYQGTECNGYNTYTFRSLTAVTAPVVKIAGDICLSSITTGASNFTDVVATYSDCTSCLPAQVTISVCGSSYADGSGLVSMSVYASMAVDTTVYVQVRWTGDLGSVLYLYLVLNTSYPYCNSDTTGYAYIGEYASTVEILNISPSPTVSQTYVGGSAYSSPSCGAC